MTRTLAGFPRITVDPEVMMGKRCIRGMRVEFGAATTVLPIGGLDDTLF